MLSIVARNVKKKLEKKLKGKVNVHAVNGSIICEIATNYFTYRYVRKCTEYDIICGVDSDTLSKNILKQYTRYIEDIIFK